MAPVEKYSRIRSRRSEKSDFRKQVLRGVIRLVLLGIVVFVFSYVTHLTFFAIKEVSVEGGVTISHNEITALVEGELQGTYFHLVPKNFVYLYPHDRIVEVLAKNTRLYDIEVMETSRNALEVTFKEYIPYALLCEKEGEEKCLYMTEEGYTFDKAPNLQGGSLTRFVLEDSEKVVLGQVVSSEEVSSIENFIEKVATEIGFRISSLLYKKNGDIELQVNGGGAIYVTGGGDLVSTFEKLKAICTSKEFAHIKPGNFQYIDVRFEDKAFVNEEIPPTTSTSTEEVKEPS